MDLDYKKFLHLKQQRLDENGTYFYWYLIDIESREGVHFHGCQYNEGDMMIKYTESDGNSHRFSTHGIESHRKNPMYEDQKPVPNCMVTCGDCYCDGSSLQAHERLGWINPDGTDDNYIWGVLYQYYGYWIDREFNKAA